MGASRITRRTETDVSAWVRLVAKDVRFTPASAIETYHCFAQADYVAIVARLPDGRLPIVRQFRPAVECETWELPAGLLEPSESPEHAARRELIEETGATALQVLALGTLYADTGRLENRIHVVCCEAALPASDFVCEPGMSAMLVSAPELRTLILAGEFNHQLHVGALALAELNGFRTGLFS